MATFPSLEPATRRYSMGVFPVTEEKGFGGGSIRFKHGPEAYSHTLELGFVGLSQAQVKLIRDHYRTQQGGFLLFDLSSDAWAGHTSLNDLIPTTTAWRYAAVPTENHRVNGYVDISVSLISVPEFKAASIPGMTRTVTVTLAAGTASS